ncbi:hypothetical protein PMAYCL1PPCAC_32702, partial [Pristionchus mayeri]
SRSLPLIRHRVMANTEGQGGSSLSHMIPDQSAEEYHGTEKHGKVGSMNSHSTGFPIEELPRELLRMIVRYMPWQTNIALRATSRLLKQYVDERMWKLVTYPLVMRILFNVVQSDDNLPRTTVKITLWVSRDNQSLFELRLASQLEDALLVERDVEEQKEQKRYEFDFESMDKHATMLGHLRNCIGENINRLEIDGSPSPNSIDAIGKTVDGVQFSTLHIDYAEINDDFGDFIEEHVLQGLEEILLVYIQMNMADPRHFLRKMSSYARHIQIDVYRLPDLAMSDMEYTELIVQMFSNKMDKLKTNFPSLERNYGLKLNCRSMISTIRLMNIVLVPKVTMSPSNM